MIPVNKKSPNVGLRKVAPKQKQAGYSAHPQALQTRKSTLSGQTAIPQKQSATNELMAVRQAFNSMEGQHRKRLHEELANVYATALRLCADTDEWFAFCRAAEWADFSGRPKDADQSDALRFAVRFAVGFPLGKDERLVATRRVSKLAGALQVLLEDKVPAAKVVDELEKRGGIEELNRERARRNRAPEAPIVWTVQCPDEVSAKLLSTLKVGERQKVSLIVKNIDGLLVEAKLLKLIRKVQKPTV
ncbi:hypothetical protein [Aminobacter ciceronei]|uniref:Uncharacterized protein n=1 Tax=Aminobacter ciceronei TaxID=150723 RepID=A0ABR6CHI1_9HYPH|nr:hypothetical protein [Aminobacter ciceronei]MBA8910687.1 hypothetical protein [Aminobacter ciceronei]MBA9024475.1 hypothetical protein [Aminobacter ciceronei]